MVLVIRAPPALLGAFAAPWSGLSWSRPDELRRLSLERERTVLVGKQIGTDHNDCPAKAVTPPPTYGIWSLRASEWFSR